MFDQLMEKLKANPKTIVFTEGTDARILSAASRLLADGLMGVILIGPVDEVKAAADKGGFDVSRAKIMDPATYEGMDAMVAKMVELRRGKMTEEQCREALLKGNYFGTMLVKIGEADALLGGATYSTADTVRPALQLVKTKPGNKIVSSCVVLLRDKPDGTQETLLMGDIAINIHPNEDEILEIGVETAKTAKVFGVDPKVAFLSFSTKGSAKDDDATKMANAAARAKEIMDVPVDGEMQFDAAVSEEVGQLKFPGSKVAGHANTFIFPDLGAGNIGYQIAQRLGGFAAYGPILQGLNAPINDLSRGCVADEVYKMAIITCALA